MDTTDAIVTLAALGQATRLEAFRLLVAHEPRGLPAGALAQLVVVPQNTLSAHLNVLAHAKLVVRERRSREIIYRVNLEHFREVALFLLKDCCDGRPEVCGALIADLAPPRSKKIRV